MLMSTLMSALVLAQTTANPPSDQTLIVWSVLLLGAAMALFVIETFVPSGGIIGITAAVCLIAGIVLLFGVDTTYGLIASTVALLALPFLVAFTLKMWPHTPIGRALMLKDQQDDSGEAEHRHPPAAVGPSVGDTGRAVTWLRPVGMCVINNRREECLAVGGTIEPNAQVRVVAVDGMHIKVKIAG